MTIETNNENQQAISASAANETEKQAATDEVNGGKTLVKMRQPSGATVTVPAEDLMAQHLAPLSMLINSMGGSFYANQAFVNLKQFEDWMYQALKEYVQKQEYMKKVQEAEAKKRQAEAEAKAKEATTNSESAAIEAPTAAPAEQPVAA